MVEPFSVGGGESHFKSTEVAVKWHEAKVGGGKVSGRAKTEEEAQTELPSFGRPQHLWFSQSAAMCCRPTSSKGLTWAFSCALSVTEI